MNMADEYTDLRYVIDEAVERKPNFQEKGIMFLDMQPVFMDWYLMDKVDKWAAARVRAFEMETGKHIYGVVSPEARGFILGTRLAKELDSPYGHLTGSYLDFVPVRKEGKSPPPVASVVVQREYLAPIKLEVKMGLIKKGKHYAGDDDVLATADTARGCADLVEGQEGNIGLFCVVAELVPLEGRSKLERRGIKVESLLKYVESKELIDGVKNWKLSNL